jgi:hypothetical protein
MTDLFERRLAQRLQAHPLPEEIPDLGTRSVRLGERMRRRRLGAVVVVLAVMLMVPAAAGLWRFAADAGEPPVSSRTSPPPQTFTGAKVVILDLRHLAQGAAPQVSTVRGGSLSLPSEETVKLPDGQFGSIAEYGSGFAWLTRTGGEIRLNMSSERLPIATNGTDVTGAEPGPSGSVMVRTNAGPVFLTSGGKLVTPPQPELRTNRMVATADHIWVENGGRVSRIQMAHLEGGSLKAQTYPQWRKVVIGDPRADRIVVIDDQGCQTIVNGSKAESVWRSCDWKLSAFSSDGRFGAGRSVHYGTIGVIDLSTGKLGLAIQQDMTPVGPQMVFDEAGRLNFRVGSPPVGQPKIGTRVDGFAFMVCDMAGACWLSTASHVDPIEFVLPNRK